MMMLQNFNFMFKFKTETVEVTSSQVENKYYAVSHEIFYGLLWDYKCALPTYDIYS
jgi:hypothetical protein